MVSKEEIILLDGIDMLLSLRESKSVSLRKLNSVINRELTKLKILPKRWYVNNPNHTVRQYIQDKYKMKNLDISENCGIGELDDEYAFIPHDIDYSWEITNAEFNMIYKNLNE